MRKFIILIGVIILTFNFTGCEFGSANEKKKEKEEADEVPVEVMKVGKGSISSSLKTSTTVKSRNSVVIFSEVNEEVERVPVQEGDTVEKGEILAELDSDNFSLLAQKAKNNYKKLKNDLERSKRMFENNLISEDEYEKVKFNARQAKLEWKQAKLDLSKTKIESTISGTLTDRFIDEGDKTSPGMKVFKVVDMKNLIAETHIPEKSLNQIDAGQKVEILSEAVPEKTFRGEITRINPVVNPQTGTVKITAEVFNEERLLRPGMFVTLRIITDTHSNTVIIPKKALIYENENEFIFQVDDKKAKKIDIETGYENTDSIEVVNKIKNGSNIIVVGQNRLKDGDPIEIVEKETEGAADDG